MENSQQAVNLQRQPRNGNRATATAQRQPRNGNRATATAQ
jgi:hypothetical protein